MDKRIDFSSAPEFGAEILALVDDGTYTDEDLLAGLAGAITELLSERERGEGDREGWMDQVVDYLTEVEFEPFDEFD